MDRGKGTQSGGRVTHGGGGIMKGGQGQEAEPREGNS